MVFKVEKSFHIFEIGLGLWWGIKGFGGEENGGDFVSEDWFCFSLATTKNRSVVNLRRMKRKIAKKSSKKFRDCVWNRSDLREVLNHC